MNVPPWVRIDEMTARTWSRLWHRRTNGEGPTDAEPQAPWPWAKQYPRHVPTALRYPQMSVGHLLDQAAARYGHLEAICFDRARMSYDDLKAQADRFALDLGLGPRPVGGPDVILDFPLDIGQAPSTYTDAAVTNLFYWNNILHDIHYQSARCRRQTGT